MIICENSRPIVSVCIPTYNYGHFISDVIDSILGQTFDDFELIIIDNYSSDDTSLIVDKYVKRDDRVRYICNKTNIGFARNLNRCLEYSSGKYVKIVCSDDVLEPNCLEEMVRILDDDPDISLVASARKLVDRHLNPIDHLSYSSRFELIEGPSIIKECLMNGNLIGEPTAVLFRRSDVGMRFNLQYKQLIDLEMWFRLLEKGNFAFIPEALCLFRQHEDQETNKNLKSVAHLDDQSDLFFEYARKPHLKLTFFQDLNRRYDIAHAYWCFDIDSALKKERISKLLGPQGILLHHFLSLFKRVRKTFSKKEIDSQNK